MTSDPEPATPPVSDYQARATEADLVVRTVLDVLATNSPDLTTAVIAGAIGAIVRLYVERTMQIGHAPTVRDVNTGLFPMVNAAAEQIVGARRAAEAAKAAESADG